MESRKIVFKETAIMGIGMLLCVGVMLGLYAALGYWNRPIWLGGILGGVLAVLNFFLMAVGTSLAADKAEAQDVKGGKSLLQMSMGIRYLVLIVVLFVLIKSGLCEVLPTVLPLAFIRPILTFGEFFRKTGDEKA
ncbi:MAG: ATP synthase subunit I [Oscillospiraceae bacterium]|nr:ATP synthase subunit I [Oscillospiraceae bacterium]